MFHWRDGLFFGRSDDGAVRILKDGVIDVTVPVVEWASIVAAVTASGETAETYQQAEALHAK